MKTGDHIRAEQHDIFPTHLGAPTITSTERVHQVDRSRWHEVRKDLAEALDGGMERCRKLTLDITICGANGWKIRQRLVDTARQASGIFALIEPRQQRIERGEKLRDAFVGRHPFGTRFEFIELSRITGKGDGRRRARAQAQRGKNNCRNNALHRFGSLTAPKMTEC